MAPCLATSTRTLQRRLREEGTTFGDVRREVRADLARACLRDRGLSIGEVALPAGILRTKRLHPRLQAVDGTEPAGLPPR